LDSKRGEDVKLFMRVSGTVAVVVGLAACSGTATTTTSGGAATSTTSPATTSTTQEATVDSTTPDMGIDPGLQPIIDQAVADLAERLDVAASDIEVVSAVLVTWPDTSLGCPKPGMAYAQVLTDGSRTTLRYNGVDYAYHTGGSVYVPFLCEKGS
jgi:hypothetical protein